MNVKIFSIVLLLLIQYSAFGFTTAQGGFYIGLDPYYQFGSSYYLNPGMDYYWTGTGWIFTTGYTIPATSCCYSALKRCQRSNSLSDCYRHYIREYARYP